MSAHVFLLRCRDHRRLPENIRRLLQRQISILGQIPQLSIVHVQPFCKCLLFSPISSYSTEYYLELFTIYSLYPLSFIPHRARFTLPCVCPTSLLSSLELWACECSSGCGVSLPYVSSPRWGCWTFQCTLALLCPFPRCVQ